MYDWIEFNDSWDQFCELGLNKPGTLIEVDVVSAQGGPNYLKTFLIGNINKVCGVCDDCVAFYYGTVKRYVVIYEGEDDEE